ncbi:hypothetical protein TRV_04199 [Trichophyton verrucosum HKI 0517]|uniref:Uncharacterized protein n=1 Tax=Trichophyton verrucosum (strain HKI 0517) TaxID=663202 RepID=D4DAQ1_TRIVH|nr:uncharacterized protein TRV_04199 [Trichophyton verrucosum HKI 0517]EFE41070.1 hypothetical protein TRV_04199 [Trichophyton verrucosum HKI 0517]
MQLIYIEREVFLYIKNQPDMSRQREFTAQLTKKERRIEPGETSGGRSKCTSKSRPCFLALRAEYQLHQAVAVFNLHLRLLYVFSFGFFFFHLQEKISSF